jgi:hypothetical protein
MSEQNQIIDFRIQMILLYQYWIRSFVSTLINSLTGQEFHFFYSTSGGGLCSPSSTRPTPRSSSRRGRRFSTSGGGSPRSSPPALLRVTHSINHQELATIVKYAWTRLYLLNITFPRLGTKLKDNTVSVCSACPVFLWP